MAVQSICKASAPRGPPYFSLLSCLMFQCEVTTSLLTQVPLRFGKQETQEMLDFCGEHNITCKIEKVPVDYVNTAMDRLVKNDVKYRFVLDVAKTLGKAVESSKEE